MECSLCTQRIAKDKGHDFFGDTLCKNCHARLRVDQYDPEKMQDAFLPILVPEGEARDRMTSLSMRAGYIGRRGHRHSATSILLVLYEKYREKTVEQGYVTSLILTARTLALYGTEQGKDLSDSETRYLLTLAEQEAALLEGEWAGRTEGVGLRFQALRAFMGVVLRADASAEELVGRILAYERLERGRQP